MRALGPLVQTALFTIVVPGIVAGGVPWMLRGHEAVATRGIEAAAAIVLLLAGVVAYLHTAFWGFAWTGGGTPAPIAPTKILVVKGLHRFVRNPMYIGVGLIIGGQAWLFHSVPIAVYLVSFWGTVHLFVVFYEEPALKRQFGDEYERYKARVPRWLPKIEKR